MNDVLIRVWRESPLQWWAELWVKGRCDSPFPQNLLTPPHKPLDPEGYTKECIALRSTRRRAQRAADRMAQRFQAGMHPKYDRPATIDKTVL